MLTKLSAFELSGKTRSMIVPTLIAAIPVIPGGMILIPRFLKQLYADIKSQWTGIMLYSRDKETRRILSIYGVKRVD